MLREDLDWEKSKAEWDVLLAFDHEYHQMTGVPSRLCTECHDKHDEQTSGCLRCVDELYGTVPESELRALHGDR